MIETGMRGARGATGSRRATFREPRSAHAQTAAERPDQLTAVGSHRHRAVQARLIRAQPRRTRPNSAYSGSAYANPGPPDRTGPRSIPICRRIIRSSRHHRSSPAERIAASQAALGNPSEPHGRPAIPIGRQGKFHRGRPPRRPGRQQPI